MASEPNSLVLGRVLALFLSPRRTWPMKGRHRVVARTDHGFEGDAHARPGGSRQLLLLDSETLNQFDLQPGVLKENITTVGLDLAGLAPGTRLWVGEALLEITKECAPCANMDKVRPGLQEEIRGRRGMLAWVVEGGPIRAGDPIRVVSAGKNPRTARYAG